MYLYMYIYIYDLHFEQRFFDSIEKVGPSGITSMGTSHLHHEYIYIYIYIVYIYIYIYMCIYDNMRTQAVCAKRLNIKR